MQDILEDHATWTPWAIYSNRDLNLNLQLVDNCAFKCFTKL